MLYKIVRMYRNRKARTIKRGLTLEEAQKHCNDESTHHVNKDGSVEWFDGFEEDG